MTTVQLFATVTTLVLLLGVAAAETTYLDQPGRALLKNVVRASSSTKSNDGVSTAESFASTKVIAEAQDALATSIATAIANVEGGAEIGAEADASAEAVATAHIKIVSNGRVISTVEGDGEACGSFFAAAESVVTVVAEAVAEGFAKSENEFAIGEAEAVSEAVKEATLKVEAEIRGSACSRGGVAEAVQELVAEQELKVIAAAFVKAFSEVSGENAKAKTEVGASATKENSGQLTSSERSTVVGEGEAGTEASASVTICDNNAKRCCNKRQRSNGFCQCGSGCFGRYNKADDVIVIRDNGSKSNCKCE
ncbi:hypothetical protein BSKO_07298 [Bryopsis sp. KO-2023]|nr:hypothetical protein BSKO_07298 [Bryopsis sp. KO-2023]